jgi:AraC-like DNA-binding protein
MAAGDRIRNGTGAEGIERMEASFHGRPFSPHRHDTYAIGMTISGVQTFNFRGQRWHCLPGECHILHPDETHDGSAGTDEGFSYRMVYVDPALVQQALHGKPLPFVANPVVDARRLAALDMTDVWDIDEDIDDLARVDLVASLAKLLVHASADPQKKPGPLALDRLVQVRDLLAGAPAVRHSMDELERVAGLDRWALARQFRAAFGTSPSHFRTHRQLDQLRRAVKGGASLRDAALDAGFADQSHMSRQFKRAYGLTPAKWAALG